jgi:uncharacterized membrane protein
MNVLSVLMRFLHIVSAVTLVGGVLAWRFGAIPATSALAAETRVKIDNAIAAAWRPFVFSAVLGLLVSGVYNYSRKTGLTPAYHAVIGVKFLLALHVFAVALIAAKQDNPKRARQLTGVAVSGVTIVVLSAVLRQILLP